MGDFKVRTWSGDMASYFEYCRRQNEIEERQSADGHAALTCEHGHNPVESDDGQWRRWTPCGECEAA